MAKMRDLPCMDLKQTIVERFMDICTERGIKPNELAVISGFTPSTVYSILDKSRREIHISTIKKLCDGLDITLGDFFSTPEFDSLEQEIK